MMSTKKYRIGKSLVSGIVITSFLAAPIPTQALSKQPMAPQVLTKQNKPLNPEEGIDFLKESKHGYDIESLVFSRDGHILVSGSLYDKIHVWNMKNKKLIRIINPGKNGSTTLALSPDGQNLYTGTYLESGIIQVWNIKTGKLIRRINSHKSGISHLTLTPDGKTLIAAGQDKTIKLWNTQTGKLIYTLKGHNAPVTAIAVSPNQNIFATSAGIQGDSKDLTIRLWDIKTGKLLQTLTNNAETSGFLAFSPDGKSLISARGKSSDYGDTNIWNLSTGKITVTIPISVIFIGFTGDGKRLLSVNSVYGVDLWDAATGANIRQIVEPIKFEDDRTYSRVYPNTAAMSLDNKTLVIGEGGVLSGYRIGIRQLNLQPIKSTSLVDTSAPKSNQFRHEGILRENMAQLLGIEEREVKLVKVEKATWQKCLPTPGRAGNCQPVTLSGHRVVMSGKGENWIYYVTSDGLITLDKRIPNVTTQTLVGRWEGKQLGSQTNFGTVIFKSDGKAYFFIQFAEGYSVLAQPQRYKVNTATKPMQIDVIPTKTKKLGTKGIFEFISNQEIKLQINASNFPYPKKFEPNKTATLVRADLNVAPAIPEIEVKNQLKQLVEREFIYYVDNGKFSGGSGKAIIATQNYTYQIIPIANDKNKMKITAAPKTANFKSFTTLLTLYPIEKDTSMLGAVTCQSTSNTKTPPEIPSIANSKLKCSTNSTPINW